MIDNKIERLEKLLYFLQNELYLHNPNWDVAIKKDDDEVYRYFIGKIKYWKIKEINFNNSEEVFDEDIILELKCKIRELKINELLK